MIVHINFSIVATCLRKSYSIECDESLFYNIFHSTRFGHFIYEVSFEWGSAPALLLSPRYGLLHCFCVLNDADDDSLAPHISSYKSPFVDEAHADDCYVEAGLSLHSIFSFLFILLFSRKNPRLLNGPYCK